MKIRARALRAIREIPQNIRRHRLRVSVTITTVALIFGGFVYADAAVVHHPGFIVTYRGHTNTFMGSYGFTRPDSTGPNFGWCIEPNKPAVDDTYAYHIDFVTHATGVPVQPDATKTRAMAWAAGRWGNMAGWASDNHSHQILGAAMWMVERDLVGYLDLNTISTNDFTAGISSADALTVIQTARMIKADSMAHANLGSGQAGPSAYHITLTATHPAAGAPGVATARLTTPSGQPVSNVRLTIIGIYTFGLRITSQAIQGTDANGYARWNFVNNTGQHLSNIVVGSYDNLPITYPAVYLPNNGAQGLVAPRYVGVSVNTSWNTVTTTSTTVRPTTTTTVPTTSSSTSTTRPTTSTTRPTTTTTRPTTTTTSRTTTTTRPTTTTTTRPTTTTTRKPTTTTTRPSTTTSTTSCGVGC